MHFARLCTPLLLAGLWGCTERATPEDAAPANTAVPTGHPRVAMPEIPPFDCQKGPPALRAPCAEAGQSCRYVEPPCTRQWSCEPSGDGIPRWADVSEACTAAPVNTGKGDAGASDAGKGVTQPKPAKNP